MHSIENSIATLKSLRDTYHSQLDVRVVTELNTVISDLEAVSSQNKKSERKEVGLRALSIMATVIRLVTNIQDLMK